MYLIEILVFFHFGLRVEFGFKYFKSGSVSAEVNRVHTGFRMDLKWNRWNIMGQKAINNAQQLAKDFTVYVLVNAAQNIFG